MFNLIEKAQGSWYNLNFKYNSQALKGVQSIIIFGENCDTPEKLQMIVQTTIWLSYRNKMPQLGKSKHTSDTGWGCMIRAGQMALAQLLKKHLKNNNDSRDQYLVNILLAFADDDQDEARLLGRSQGHFMYPYSIQKIVALAQKQFQLQPGEWYQPNHIVYLLQELHNLSPLKGAEDLELLIFNDSSLFKDQIQEKIEEKSVAIFILSRIGLQKAQIESLKIVDDIMGLTHFQGMIGGTKSKAYYMIGRMGQQYIYMDPHYVQECADSNSIIFNQEQFHQTEFKTIINEQIDSSLCLIFYLRDQRDLNDFWNQFMNVRNKYGNQFFVYTAEQSPNYSQIMNSSQFKSVRIETSFQK